MSPIETKGCGGFETQGFPVELEFDHLFRQDRQRQSSVSNPLPVDFFDTVVAPVPHETKGSMGPIFRLGPPPSDSPDGHFVSSTREPTPRPHRIRSSLGGSTHSRRTRRAVVVTRVVRARSRYPTLERLPVQNHSSFICDTRTTPRSYSTDPVPYLHPAACRRPRTTSLPDDSATATASIRTARDHRLSRRYAARFVGSESVRLQRSRPATPVESGDFRLLLSVPVAEHSRVEIVLVCRFLGFHRGDESEK